MATRRLSRTIVEGGRASRDKYERKLQIKKNRRKSRDFCRKTLFDENADLRPTVGIHYYREFHDRLSPLYNWMRAHVGTSWDIVYSKLCAVKSRESMQGWHFLDHVKDMIFTPTGSNSNGYGFYIDEDGIIQEDPRRIQKRPPNKELRKRYADWIGNRKIQLVGTKYFWYEPVIVSQPMIKPWLGIIGDLPVYEFRSYINGWRQGFPLTKKEIGYMEWIKETDIRIWRKIIEA